MQASSGASPEPLPPSYLPPKSLAGRNCPKNLEPDHPLVVTGRCSAASTLDLLANKMTALPGAAPGGAAALLAPRNCGRQTAKNSRLAVYAVCEAFAGQPESQTPATHASAKNIANRWSGLTADATTLDVAKGPIAAGGEVLRIQVRQGFGGVLTRDLDGRNRGDGASRFLPAGTPVYGLAEFEQPGLAGALFIWCAPAALAKTATRPDRALCFLERRQKRKGYGIGPVSTINADKLNTVMMSREGASPYVPDAVVMAYSPVKRPAAAAPTGQPFPQAVTLILRWKPEGERGVRFDALIDDGGGERPFRDWTDEDATGVDHALRLAGGVIGYSRAGESLTAAMIEPVALGGLVTFAPDQSGDAER